VTPHRQDHSDAELQVARSWSSADVVQLMQGMGIDKMIVRKFLDCARAEVMERA